MLSDVPLAGRVELFFQKNGCVIHLTRLDWEFVTTIGLGLVVSLELICSWWRNIEYKLWILSVS